MATGLEKMEGGSEEYVCWLDRLERRKRGRKGLVVFNLDRVPMYVGMYGVVGNEMEGGMI